MPTRARSRGPARTTNLTFTSRRVKPQTRGQGAGGESGRLAHLQSQTEQPSIHVVGVSAPPDIIQECNSAVEAKGFGSLEGCTMGGRDKRKLNATLTGCNDKDGKVNAFYYYLDLGLGEQVDVFQNRMVCHVLRTRLGFSLSSRGDVEGLFFVSLVVVLLLLLLLLLFCLWNKEKISY